MLRWFRKTKKPDNIELEETKEAKEEDAFRLFVDFANFPYEERGEDNYAKEEEKRIARYKKSLFTLGDRINDETDLSVPDLKSALRSSSRCSNRVFTPSELRRYAVSNNFIALAIRTISNEAARDAPSVEISFVDETRKQENAQNLIDLMQEVDFKLNKNNILNQLKLYVRQSKVFGSVLILKLPKYNTDAEYWKNPFNIESIETDNSMEFKLLDPEDFRPYFNEVQGTIYSVNDIYDEPEYWQVTLRGRPLVVHKSHLIRLVEEPVSREELFRFNHSGVSLVSNLIPLANLIEDYEFCRYRLISLKSTCSVTFPRSMLEDMARANCYGSSISSGATSVNLADVVTQFATLQEATKSKYDVVGLVEGQVIENLNVSLTDVNANIDSCVAKFAAMASIPVSTLGLTPPRGLNDSGAVEADGSRRAVEANQNTILKPILNDIVKVYIQEAINKLGLRKTFLVDELNIFIAFKPVNAVTALEAANIFSSNANAISRLYVDGILSHFEAKVALQKINKECFEQISLNEDDDYDYGDDEDEDTNEASEAKEGRE